MDWTAQVDGYCERLAPGLWAEPLNLVTNAAFLVAAAVMFGRCRYLAEGRMLAVLLFVIGIASGLFHSLATRWAGAADSLSILVFVIAYLGLANRDFLGLRGMAAHGATLAGLLVAMLAGAVIGHLIPAAGASAAYGGVAALILAYGIGLLSRHRATGLRLIGGAAVLAVSITFRALDAPLCPGWPAGTHFLWHLLNALMLAWMIETWRRHRLEGAALRR